MKETLEQWLDRMDREDPRGKRGPKGKMPHEHHYSEHKRMDIQYDCGQRLGGCGVDPALDPELEME